MSFLQISRIYFIAVISALAFLPPPRIVSERVVLEAPPIEAVSATEVPLFNFLSLILSRFDCTADDYSDWS
jgi:hypothetical protein